MKKQAFFALLFFHFSLIIPCSAQIISTIAGNGIGGFSGNGGPATAAEIIPEGIAVDIFGNVYISDFDSCVRKINTSGVISTFAGTGVSGYSGDGGPATAAELNSPLGMIADKNGIIYVADTYNNVIRKINNLGVISTFAGNGFISGGFGGYSGDGGLATLAELDHPFDVAIDKIGNVYIADVRNNVIRKVDTLGIISTFAGTGYGAGTGSQGGFTGDGGLATAAEFFQPGGVSSDNFGNIYISDGGNIRIRKVNSSGIISTVAGNGSSGFFGDGGQATAAEIGDPWSVSVDDSGNFYIGDIGNNRIRKINTFGIINTIAGNGIAGFSGDGGPATAAELFSVGSVALDTNENIYSADYTRIRKIWMVLDVSAGVTSNINCTGGSNGSAIAKSSEGMPPYTYSWSNGSTDSTTTGFSAGTYTVHVTDSESIKGSATVTITQPPAISISADSINATGSNCNGSAWVTVNGGTFPYSYLWGGGLTTDTITNQCIGNYCSVITDANGCMDSVCVNIESVTGINNISNSPSIEIYPNPINSDFTIELSNTSGAYNFELYNILGEKISWTQLKTATTQINMSSEADGIYLYRILKEDGELIGEGRIIIDR